MVKFKKKRSLKPDWVKIFPFRKEAPIVGVPAPQGRIFTELQLQVKTIPDR